MSPTDEGFSVRTWCLLPAPAVESGTPIDSATARPHQLALEKRWGGDAGLVSASGGVHRV